jgi:hypothetical protein
LGRQHAAAVRGYHGKPPAGGAEEPSYGPAFVGARPSMNRHTSQRLKVPLRNSACRTKGDVDDGPAESEQTLRADRRTRAYQLSERPSA